MHIVFLIWTAVSILCLIIGITTWNSKKAAGFFTGVKPPKVKDVTAYNHAVAKIWFVFTILFELLGTPFLWISETSVYGILITIFVMFWVFGLIIAYLIVERKYKE